MTSSDWFLLAITFVLVVCAGLLVAAEAGAASPHSVRADRLVADNTPRGHPAAQDA
jgi:hypothetical protein